MANKRVHRRFGNVRKLQSGRWQGRYQGPDGLMRSAPETFGSKRDAEQWLTVIESEVLRGDWSDPLAGRIPLGEYGQKWIEEHKLGQRTREEYDRFWRRHIDPFLGPDRASGDLDRHHPKLAGSAATRGSTGGPNGEGLSVVARRGQYSGG